MNVDRDVEINLEEPISRSDVEMYDDEEVMANYVDELYDNNEEIAEDDDESDFDDEVITQLTSN